MIPHKLYIKNFLSYGPETQTIEFAPHKLICLSGKNGHGKSALLDAITWALWGCARKTLTSVKPDEGLLHLGQTQMFVMLDFELNGVMYRVRREFLNTYGKPYANVDFGLYDPTTDKFEPLTDKTIRKTQEKIEQTLRLSYEAFANSAFLRQGHSNEFSKKSPKERKEILASILGLDQYEVLRKLAIDKSKAAANEIQTLKAFAEKLELEMGKKDEIGAATLVVEQKLKELGALEKSIERDDAAHRDAEKKLQEQSKQHEMLAYELKKVSEAEHAHQCKVRELLAAWRALHKKHLSLPDRDILEKQKKELMFALQEHQTKFQRTLELKELYLGTKEKSQQLAESITKAHAAESQNLRIALERMRVEQISLEQTAKELQIKSEATARELADGHKITQELSKQLTQEKTIADILAKTTEQFEKRKAAYQQFCAQANQLNSELAGIAQKELLVHNEQDPSCPLCEQNLSASRRKFLRSKFSKDQQLAQHQFDRLSRVIKKLKALLLEQHAQIEALKKDAEQLRTVQIKLEENNKQSAKIQSTHVEILKLSEELAKKLVESATALSIKQKTCDELAAVGQKILEMNTDYQTMQKQLADIVTEGKAILYNQVQHQATQLALQNLETQLASYAHIEADTALQAQRKEQVAELCHDLRSKKKQKVELLSQIDAFKSLLADEQKMAAERTLLIARTKEINKEKEVLLHEQGRLTEQQKKLVQFEAEHKEQQKTVSKLNQTIFDYQTIATATGKDGIQALLIEEAIPEIEHEANYLLSRLTNNQAQIFIESLRDLKKGGTKETLDIKISDPAGIRPYEMFSGGEAFRIDFALRIAVSKLLARRAGTALQTLIIDEGFGSQDEEGLSNIMDCIHKIQDDFSLIIIVSHLSTMKDQFPVHFVVEKRAHASRVNVLELG